jgi:hypothetical protein
MERQERERGNDARSTFRLLLPCHPLPLFLLLPTCLARGERQVNYCSTIEALHRTATTAATTRALSIDTSTRPEAGTPHPTPVCHATAVAK